MNILFKKLISILLVLMFSFTPVIANENIKTRASMNSYFTQKEVLEEISFTANKDIRINEKYSIPKGSNVIAKNIQSQKERRWHKSGYIILHVIKYTPNGFSVPRNVEDDEIFLIAKKYEQVDKKEVAILATELVLTQAASVFAPGVDILYFFTKGAIQRKKDPNWFKAGVSNAYDHSICWFWLKGKSIELAKGDEINIKGINKQRANQLKSQIEKRNYKNEMKNLKNDLRKEYKIVKRKEKQEIKIIKKELKQEEKLTKRNKNNVYADESNINSLSENDNIQKEVYAAAKVENENNEYTNKINLDSLSENNKIQKETHAKIKIKNRKSKLFN